MKTQISHLLLAASLVPSLLAAGCGGTGMGMGAGMGMEDGASRSSFEGQWVGTYDSPPAGTNGTLNLTIDANGKVAGTMHDSVANSDATMSGVISSSGGMNAQARFPGQQTCSLNGLMMLNQAGHTSGCHELGHMVGTVMLHMGSGTYETRIDLTPR